MLGGDALELSIEYLNMPKVRFQLEPRFVDKLQC